MWYVVWGGVSLYIYVYVCVEREREVVVCRMSGFGLCMGNIYVFYVDGV